MSDTPLVEVTIKLNNLTIKIAGILHVYIPRFNNISFQSWKYDKFKYYAIEYYTETGTMLTEYDTPELWQNILNQIESLI